MKDERLCDNCKYAENHETVKHSGGEYVKVDCKAPIPGHIATFGDEGIGVGHKAAQYCGCYEAH